MATKPIRTAVKKLKEGLKTIPPKALQTGPRRIKPSGRITKEDLGKGVASIGSMMSQGMSASAAKNLMKKNAKTIARRTKPASVISRRRARVKR